MGGRQIPQWLKKYIVSLYLHGHTIEEVAGKAGVAVEVAREVVEEFEAKATGSLDEAAQSYQVEDELSLLREVARQLREMEMSVREAWEGCQLMRELKKLGVEVEQLGGFIRACKLALPPGVDVTELVQSALALYQTCLEMGVSPREVPSYYERKVREVKELERKLSELRRQVAELASRHSRIIAKLSKHGLTLNELEKLVEVLEEARKLGFDTHKVIEALSRRRQGQSGLGS